MIRVSDAFAADLIAQAAALRGKACSLTLATPRFETPDAKTLSKENLVDLKLSDHGIADAPLPAYRTMPQFIAAKSTLEKAILATIATADVVQLGAGGHPMALGQFAWPLIDPTKHKRIFVFAGDPLPGREKAITSGRNPAKILAKRMAVRTFAAFCRQAAREADAVFAHDPAVQKRFAKDWNDRCETFVASPIGDDALATPKLIAARLKRLANPKSELNIIAIAGRGATAGVDHVTRAVEKIKRFGIAANLVLSDAADAAAFDSADLFVAAPLVPTENASIYFAAARGLPILSYRAGAADALAEAAGAAACVERGEADRLSARLLDLARDRQTLSAMAAAARGWAATVTRDSVHRQRAAIAAALVSQKS